MSATIPSATRAARSSVACRDAPVVVEAAHFRGSGGADELHLVARPTAYAGFEVQLDWLHRAYREALGTLNVRPRSAVLRRFFCGDITNQAYALAASAFGRDEGDNGPCATSLVGQPPAAPAKVALWAYHVSDPAQEADKCAEDRTITLARGPLRHHWTCGVVCPGAEDRPLSAAQQTTGLLETYESFLRSRGLTWAGNVVRTWLYLRDIDADYDGFAAARREHFAARGLTPQTHYIASTGIQGTCAEAAARIAMDAYAIAGLQAEQVAYLRAPHQLSPTHVYGVTFERGTAIAYGDRKHVMISGTASIDERGNTLHPGDVSRQLARTLDNIAALLAEAEADAADLCAAIAYVRDGADADLVRRGIGERFGDVPLAVVAGSICRPAWLVEVEGQAIVPARNPALRPF